MRNLLKKWETSRIVRLVIGVAVSVYAITSKDYMFFVLAGLFLLPALLNISCCGAAGCSSSDAPDQKQVYKDAIKTYKPNRK